MIRDAAYSNRREDTFLTLRKDDIVSSTWTPKYRVVHERGGEHEHVAVDRLRRHVMRGGKKQFFWSTVHRVEIGCTETADALHRMLEQVLDRNIDMERRVVEEDGGGSRNKASARSVMATLKSIIAL